VTGVVVDADMRGLRIREEDKKPEDTKAVSLKIKKAPLSSSAAQWSICEQGGEMATLLVTTRLAKDVAK
jgi:hypothetical protein